MTNGPERASTTAEARSSSLQPGVWMVVFGAVLAVLAPLAGFLGGTKVGSSGAGQDVDALLLWLITGLGVGAAGALLAVVGMLRWTRASRHSRPV